MSDKIGVLGEATTLTSGTTTVYTVPSAKAARGRIMFAGQGAADATTDLKITVNAIIVFDVSNITASYYIWSSSSALYLASAALPTGLTAAQVVGPYALDFYLAAADTVTYTIGGTTALAMNVQFVGTEVDV